MIDLVGTWLSFICIFLVFEMLSFIVILYKVDKYYICPLGKSVMDRLKLNIMFVTLVP